MEEQAPFTRDVDEPAAEFGGAVDRRPASVVRRCAPPDDVDPAEFAAWLKLRTAEVERLRRPPERVEHADPDRDPRYNLWVVYLRGSPTCLRAKRERKLNNIEWGEGRSGLAPRGSIPPKCPAFYPPPPMSLARTAKERAFVRRETELWRACLEARESPDADRRRGHCQSKCTGR